MRMEKSMEKKLKDQGTALGLAVVVGMGICLYFLQDTLFDVVGRIITVLLFAAFSLGSFLVIGIVSDKYVSVMSSRLCAQRGHAYEDVVPEDGQPYRICTNCYHCEKRQRKNERDLM